MQHTASVVLFLTLIAKTCFAGLSMKTSKTDKSLVEATIDILESCYTNHSVVGIAGPSAGSIIESISSRQIVIPTTLVDETSTVAPYSFDPAIDHPEKLHVFIITVTDPNSLVETLAQVRNSKWWNHMASFLLIDSAEVTNECSNAYEMLRESWKMNVLNSKFICLHRTKGTLIYTFNPYASKAPNPWQLENIYKGMNDHVWTLFVRKYVKNESRCDGLDFDKTVNLDGYKIRGVTYSTEHWRSRDLGGILTTNFYMINITTALLINGMNANYSHEDWGGLDEAHDQNYLDFALRDTQKGIYDICLHPNFTNPWTVLHRFTYPFYRVEITVVTPYRGYMSQLDKLICVLDKRSRFGVFAVLTITLLFSKFFLRKPFILAIMDIFLLVSNAGLRRIPQKTAPRIYLAGLFIFVVTIQGIYSGQIASLLIKEVRLPTVDTWEDLARSNHTIRITSSLPSLFDGPEFKERSIEYRPYYGDDDANTAYVGEKSMLIELAASTNRHLSREYIAVWYLGFPIRKDWPLEEKFNRFSKRLQASGILDLLRARALRKNVRSLEAYERQGQESDGKPLTLKHLGFAFKFLAIGLGCATIAFAVETARLAAKISRSQELIVRRIEYIE